MSQIVETVDVDVPVASAYDLWSHFETFPAFLDDVDSVTKESDTRSRWVVSILGQSKEFTTEISEQKKDDRIAWTSTGGDVDHAGVVTFHRLSDTTSRVAVQIDWEPEGFLESVGAAIGAPKIAVKRQLDKFTKYVEAHPDGSTPSA